MKIGNVAELHIESHAPLASQFTGGQVVDGGRPVDAIIVPTVRPGLLRPAMDLAMNTGCRLVILCSDRQQAARANTLATAGSGSGSADLAPVIVTVPSSYQHDLLTFLTTEHPEVEFQPSCHADIARKRNIALLIGRMSGWRTALFLDDDICGLTPAMVRKAAALLTYHRAVGFKITDFPDNSVVCHANRLSGRNQDTFVGCNAVLLDLNQIDSFFPAVYNEDWLYLFKAVRKRSVAIAGTVTQRPYDPFANTGRATSEEFGDLIAEGLYRLLHDDLGDEDATQDFWQEIIVFRTRFINDIAARLSGTPEVTAQTGRALMSLAAASTRISGITPAACVSFLHSWRSDLSEWQDRLHNLVGTGTPEAAVTRLGLSITNTTTGE